MTWHFAFMHRRRLFMALSGILLLVTVISLATRGLNFGIDFRGGVVMDITAAQPTTIETVRGLVAAEGIQGAQVQELNNDPKQYEIRTPPLPDTATKGPSVEGLVGVFQKQLGADPSQNSINEVSPTIGQELRGKAILAVVLATVLMTAYLAIRFQFGEAGAYSGLKFAVAAVVALLHDITLTVGLFSVFHLQVNSPFVAAVLTVYGYSMNDTIIVFDRIRERLRLQRREPLERLIDVSLNQVLNRTVTTVATVILALVAVIALGGGGDMRELALALLVGVSFGTYSSIFIASPIFLWLANRGRGTGPSQGVSHEAAAARS